MALGHSVLAVPVPQIDVVVRERTAYYDASFVSADPGFVHAHITLLAPWIDEPTPADLATVARSLPPWPRPRSTSRRCSSSPAE